MSEIPAMYSSKNAVALPFCLSLYDIAQIVHGAAYEFKSINGGVDPGPWQYMDSAKKERLIEMVRWIVMNSGAGPESFHGYVVSGDKEIPSWDNLPDKERASILLFLAIVRSLSPFVAWPE